MKKFLLTIMLLAVLCLTALTGCASKKDYKSKLTELDKYVFEVDEYTELDYAAADKFYAERNDNWGGGCSAITKMIDGHRIVGRNMDQSISNKCAYIIRTNAGKYRTLGLAYTHRDYSPDLNDIEKNGLSEEFYKVLPFMCDDVMNDAGLHIEINMRHAEFWPNGEDKYACSGTNPASNKRVYMFELPRYIGENCATVEEAKEYVSTLNVYSQNHYWNYCFIISDSEGHASLLEFSTNDVCWLDEDKLENYKWLEVYGTKAIGQANFYLNHDAWITQDIKSGEGRFVTLQKGIDAVGSRSDMYDLIRKVQYSSYYKDYDVCKENHFDPRSEVIGEVSWAQYDVVNNPAMEDGAKLLINATNAGVLEMPRQQKRDANVYWESIFTEVVDVNAQQIFVRMYENEDMLYLIDFNGTRKLDSINEWND